MCGSYKNLIFEQILIQKGEDEGGERRGRREAQEGRKNGKRERKKGQGGRRRENTRGKGTKEPKERKRDTVRTHLTEGKEAVVGRGDTGGGKRRGDRSPVENNMFLIYSIIRKF